MFWCFVGIEAFTHLGEEFKRPERDFPLALLLGVTIRGLTYESERWRLASVGDWQPTGSHLPQPAVVEALQGFVREVFELFGPDASARAA